jgi:hypothetical protein
MLARFSSHDDLQLLIARRRYRTCSKRPRAHLLLPGCLMNIGMRSCSTVLLQCRFHQRIVPSHAVPSESMQLPLLRELQQMASRWAAHAAALEAAGVDAREEPHHHPPQHARRAGRKADPDEQPVSPFLLVRLMVPLQCNPAALH